MTFEIQAFTVLTIIDGTFVKLFRSKIISFPLLQMYKVKISNIGQFWDLLVPEAFNFAFSEVLKSVLGQHNI